MKTLTIFEGCDCSGKTSIAEAYSQTTGGQYTHSGPFEGFDSDQLFMEYVYKMMPACFNEAHVVMDRCWLSEEPYSKYYGRENRLSKEQIDILTRMARSANVICVMCLPPWNSVCNDYLSRKDTEYLKDVSELREVYDYYQTMVIFATSKMPQIVIDYTKWKSIDGIVEMLTNINRELYYGDSFDGN